MVSNMLCHELDLGQFHDTGLILVTVSDTVKEHQLLAEFCVEIDGCVTSFYYFHLRALCIVGGQVFPRLDW